MPEARVWPGRHPIRGPRDPPAPRPDATDLVQGNSEPGVTCTESSHSHHSPRRSERPEPLDPPLPWATSRLRYFAVQVVVGYYLMFYAAYKRHDGLNSNGNDQSPSPIRKSKTLDIFDRILRLGCNLKPAGPLLFLSQTIAGGPGATTSCPSRYFQ